MYAQMIAGHDAPAYGEAKNSWLTGTAAWNFVAITQYILGIRPEYAGLRVDPCIPYSWDGWRVTRTFHGAVYEIEVTNPDHVNHGVRTIEIDGKMAAGNVVPVFGDGATHRIRVVMEK